MCKQILFYPIIERKDTGITEKIQVLLNWNLGGSDLKQYLINDSMTENEISKQTTNSISNSDIGFVFRY